MTGTTTTTKEGVRFEAGDAVWIIRQTASGLQITMIPATACSAAIIPVSGNVFNVVPGRSSEEGELLPYQRPPSAAPVYGAVHVLRELWLRYKRAETIPMEETPALIELSKELKNAVNALAHFPECTLTENWLMAEYHTLMRVLRARGR